MIEYTFDSKAIIPNFFWDLHLATTSTIVGTINHILNLTTKWYTSSCIVPSPVSPNYSNNVTTNNNKFVSFTLHGKVRGCFHVHINGVWRDYSVLGLLEILERYIKCLIKRRSFIYLTKERYITLIRQVLRLHR